VYNDEHITADLSHVTTFEEAKAFMTTFAALHGVT
jgi:hypothetical protein